MRIRTRLTLWYAGVMFASFMLLGALAYHEFVDEPRDDHPHGHRGGGSGRVIQFMAAMVVSSGAPAALLAIVGGWLLMRKAFVPLETLTRAVERTHERSLHERLPRTENGDELDRLTEVFNAMTARLDQSFQRIREFTLHASHELKTPLTVMQGEIETALRDETMGPAERERLLSQLDEVSRLASIVDGLSLLTKADAGQVTLALAPLRLDELAREAVEDAQHLAQGLTLQVTLARCEPLDVLGDRHRLRQLLLNLVDNAVKYNRPNGSVTLALGRAGQSAELAVANTGPGIPPEQRARAFDRFFRGDASHGQAVEGCGLGLSIAQWIVQAHGGSIRIDSEPGGMTTVTVRLPLAEASLS